MKPIFCLIAFLFICSLHAQTGVIVARQPGGPVTTGDTVSAGSYVCLDSNVVSCQVTIAYNGILRERSYSYNCFLLESDLKPGTKVYVTQITAQPQPGVRVKMPERIFIVR